MTTFEEANNYGHPVETQWHYKVLIPLGWVAETHEATGLVRSYDYSLLGTDLKIRCTTGVNADHWQETTHKKAGGYWGTLEKFAKEIDSKR
jgi:hypothetical protein